jgi:hypothetical protein
MHEVSAQGVVHAVPKTMVVGSATDTRRPSESWSARRPQRPEVRVVLPRVFVSFDLDHDNDLKQRLVEQSVDGRSGLVVYDWSIREAAADWRDKLGKRIANVDSFLVLCGGFTDCSANVAAELEIARDAERPYFLLDGRPPTTRKPAGAPAADRLLAWTQANLLAIGGGRVPAPITVEFDDLRPESRSRLRLRRR